jgi:anthranilate synthase component 1
VKLRVRPDPSEFAALSARWPLVPVWAELMGDSCTPVGVFPSLAGPGPGTLLESVERSERWGRFSFVSSEPAALVSVGAEGLRIERQVRDLPLPPGAARGPALELLRSVTSSLRAPRLPELPPLTGGLVGMVAYEAASLLGGYPCPGGPGLPGPPVSLQVVDRAVVFDHWRQRILLVAHVPAGGRGAYLEGAAALEDLAGRLAAARPPAPDPLPDAGPSPAPSATNMEDDRFRDVVRRLKEHVGAGDIFQAVPSRRLTYPAPEGGFPVYRRLRVLNPSPYMFFLRLPGLELAGSSPEPLVRVEGRRVLTRPIAGTRPRGGDEEEDRRLEAELLADPKERAEHAMLVDLARNDLGRVCRPGSVRPTELMVVERFSRVMHLVSTVEGELEEGLDALDALAATFPAGTVTGAPKERAMELIAELEPTARGPYAGGVGYLSFAGDLDFCITIRTAVIEDGVAHVQAGAGVVADSDPDRELAETRAKASAVAQALAEGFGSEGGTP